MSRFKRRGFLSVASLLGLSSVAKAAPLSSTVLGKERDGLSAELKSEKGKTDVGVRSTSVGKDVVPPFVTSLNRAPVHNADGGWARQLNRQQFSALEDLALVQMKLESGAMREMFWRKQAEWGFVVSGTCRIMSLDEQGRSSVDDVGPGDIWSIPAGTPHSIIGLAPTGAEVLIFLDDASASEFQTSSVASWMAAASPDDLAKNFGVPAAAFSTMRGASQWISRISDPEDLDAARKSARIRPGAEKIVYLFSRSKFYARAAGGYMQVVDAATFPSGAPFSAESDVIHVNGMREMHWHPHAAELGIVLSGTAELSVVSEDGSNEVARLDKGDVWSIPCGQGHCIVNRGAEDLRLLTVYKAAQYAEYSLSDWLTHVPVQVAAETLKLPSSIIDKFPNARRGFMPR